MEELEIATCASDEEMPEEHGLPRPRFEELGDEFRVTLIGPGEQFMEGRAAPEWVRGGALRVSYGGVLPELCKALRLYASKTLSKVPLYFAQRKASIPLAFSTYHQAPERLSRT